MEPVVSIVTVSFNAEQCIGITIESVLAQTYTDYEYVFIDGKSSDKTVDIIESYRAAFEKKGIRYYVLSEKDAGIYDAMNKGISKACGKWVQMLNAGDSFADENVLKDVFSACDASSDVLYGDTIIQDGEYYKIIKAGDLESMKRDMPMCHQSVFVKRSLLAEYGFDTSYRLAADYNQLLRAYLEGKCFQYVHKLIAVYDTSGESEKNFQKTIAEQNAIRKSYGIECVDLTKRTLFLRARARLIKRIIPGVSRSQARGWYRTLNDVKKQY